MERKWRALIIVCVAIFMLLLDITVVNTALPSIQKDLSASFTDLQWVIDAYTLALAAIVLTASALDLASWLLWAGFALFGFCASCKAAVERATQRHLDRRKLRYALA